MKREKQKSMGPQNHCMSGKTLSKRQEDMSIGHQNGNARPSIVLAHGIRPWKRISPKRFSTASSTTRL